MPPERRRYAPLDGLRGLAIVAVFWFHYRIVPHSPGEWGWAGVDLFFVLSGFLITGILFESLGEGHYFRNFYVRRAMRIFPLYLGLWLVFIAVMVAEGRFEAGYLAWPAYIGNYLGAYSLVATPDQQHFVVLPAATICSGKFGISRSARRSPSFASACTRSGRLRQCWKAPTWCEERAAR